MAEQTQVREIRFSRGPLQFRAVDSGPLDGEPVVLLHGFPQRTSSWDAVVPLLHAAGLRTLVLDQRGYCATARPRGRRAYRLAELVDDVIALLDNVDLSSAGLAGADHHGAGSTAAHGPTAHIVGHDWGAAVAWGVAAAHPDRVRTLTAVSVPHPGAFLRAMFASDQLLRSWYIGFFQLPWLPERVLTSRGTRAERALTGMGMTAEMVERFRREMVADGAVPGGLGWYRALPFASPGDATARVRVPTTFVWSDRDPALGRGGAERTARFVDADYRFAEMTGASHWIPEERPAELAREIIARAQG
ncbi:alpha/beta fold hydrolase [Rhodococcus sp. IEGM 1408]|uniref:alpha/beta fold hydrolase n=1 Tax=Rhodococcus sp. IEGM 1408 TaxID=3082220 RepID=UPI0029536B1E|nr:alpha/beta fold hydrolase [Rhodococcus sp. IEGM 1408]MDV8000152.1 alpha/beta fold hydrolase [Rhodococcus sp. IEGM 1408]